MPPPCWWSTPARAGCSCSGKKTGSGAGRRPLRFDRAQRTPEVQRRRPAHALGRIQHGFPDREREIGCLLRQRRLSAGLPQRLGQRKGRKGHGIWVHGTPRDTYSRPPRASNGCVVLPNDDIDTLQKWFQLGRTPVILADTIDWVDPSQADSMRQILAGAIQKWTEDWSSNDMDRYLSHYSDDFKMGEQDLEGWERDKRRVAAAKSWVKVSTSDLSMLLVPGERDLAVVEFEQDYRSSNLSNLMRKRQYWRFEDGAWKIVYEGSIGKAG
ncbi:MAG: L,D-transpeptidase family protein [Fibrobacteres bacterium]|nr:L,D-transpeptidase family protein [Fibrobacterota bacterium]